MKTGEKEVLFKNGRQMLQGMYLQGDSVAAALVCHPHPLMGGSMDNNVVEAIQTAFARQGLSTLRFNFRGVGKSTGVYDEGRGERDDITAACDFLAAQGSPKIVLAGYSFGAWVCHHWLKENRKDLEGVIMVSLPDRYFRFDWNGFVHEIGLIVCGDEDPFCDVENLMKQAGKLSATFALVAGADHFYSGNEADLEKILRKYYLQKNEKKA